ncbi:MAG: LPS-assembly protein LptD [Verrucomicrobiae bacterium]|nr:LPS-assembly protein LptD [Verrucomicrobiae bacterium]
MWCWGKFLGPVLLVLSLLPAHAAEKNEPAIIDARELNFDKPRNLAFGKGEVLIRYQDATLRADEVKFNTLTKEAWATGNVRLNRGGQEWVTPSAYYHFETRQLKADEIGGFFEPVYLHAEDLAQVASNQYSVARATISTCDYPEPHYRVQATHAEIYPQDRVVLFNCTLWLGRVPVFWLPVMSWSLAGDPQLFSLNVGHSSRWGYYGLLTTHWQLNPNFKLDVHLDERSGRGFGTGADLIYEFDQSTTGLVRGYYANDARPRDSEDRAAGVSRPTHRYLGEWQHKQFFTPDLSLTIDLHRQGDTDVYADFFSTEFHRNVEPGSVADLTRRGQNYTLSLQVRPQFNDFFAEVERLPEAKWTVNRVRVGSTPVFYEGETSAGYYSNERGSTGDPLFTGSTVRFDSAQQLVVPHTLFGWWALVPRAGGRYTYYTRAPSTAADTQEVRRVLGNLGVETSFKLSRTWTEYKNQRWGIDGLRHIIQPFADYSWVPTPNVTSAELFQFDTIRSITLTNGETFPVTRYVPLENPGFTALDAIDRENTVRFGLRQKLQTRRAGQPWDLLEVTAWTDFHIEQDAGQTDFANLFGNIAARPTDWLTVNTFSRYDFHTGLLRELNSEARISRDDRWAVGLGTRYLRDDSNLIAVSLTGRLTPRWVARVYQRFDMEDGQWEEQDYQLRQELHDWYINYGFRYRSQRTRQDEKAIYFSVTLKAFPGTQLGINRVDLGTGD